MNQLVDIQKVKIFRFLNVYTVKLENSDSEFEKFCINHTSKYKEDLDIIFTLLNQIGQKSGIQERFFRHEGSILALPNKKSNLRLYCSVYGEKNLVLFNGGYKPKEIRTTQEVPDLNSRFSEGELYHRRILSNINLGTIEIENDFLTGELSFYL